MCTRRGSLSLFMFILGPPLSRSPPLPLGIRFPSIPFFTFPIDRVATRNTTRATTLTPTSTLRAVRGREGGEGWPFMVRGGVEAGKKPTLKCHSAVRAPLWVYLSLACVEAAERTRRTACARCLLENAVRGAAVRLCWCGAKRESASLARPPLARPPRASPLDHSLVTFWRPTRPPSTRTHSRTNTQPCSASPSYWPWLPPHWCPGGACWKVRREREREREQMGGHVPAGFDRSGRPAPPSMRGGCAFRTCHMGLEHPETRNPGVEAGGKEGTAAEAGARRGRRARAVLGARPQAGRGGAGAAAPPGWQGPLLTSLPPLSPQTFAP